MPPREEWDFTSITEEFLKPAIIYEYARELDETRELSGWLNMSTDEAAARAFARIVNQPSEWKTFMSLDPTLNLAISEECHHDLQWFDRAISEILSFPAFLDGWHHQLSTFADLEGIFNDLWYITNVELNDAMSHFLIASDGLRKNRPWATLPLTEMQMLASLSTHYGAAPTAVSVLRSKCAKISSEFWPEKTFVIEIDWAARDTEIVESFRNKLKNLRPAYRRTFKLPEGKSAPVWEAALRRLVTPTSKHPGRAAAQPFDALRQLSALRLSRHTSRQAFLKQCVKPRADIEAQQDRIEKLWPGYSSDGAWSDAKKKAKAKINQSKSGDLSFAKIDWNYTDSSGLPR